MTDMTIKVFVEGVPLRSEPERWIGRTPRVREWGWRMTAATGQALAESTSTYRTKKAAVAAGIDTAIGWYHFNGAEVIELRVVKAVG